LIAEGAPSPAPELPVVLKPRFGSWGRDVVLCATADKLDRELARFAQRSWFPAHGVLAQELVEPLGWDLRVVVSGGRVVGGARRVAAPGEWRTNVALGGHIEPAAPPPLRGASLSRLPLRSAVTSSASTSSRWETASSSGGERRRRLQARLCPHARKVFRNAVHELVRVAPAAAPPRS
jgi:hypothetical protein